MNSFHSSCLLLLLLVTGSCLGVTVTLKDNLKDVPIDLILGAENQILVASIVQEGRGPLEFYWTYEEKEEIAGDGGIILKVDKGATSRQEPGYKLRSPNSLEIVTVEKSHTGVFHVRALAENDAVATDSALYTVRVVYPPTIPVCQFPSDHTLTRGYEQELKCVSSDGVPQVEYRWYRNGDVLPADSSTDPNYSNASFVIDKSTGTLKFMEVNDANEGNYYCQAHNSIGETTCTAVDLVIKDQNVGQIVGIVFGVIVLLAIIILVILILYKRGTCQSDDKEEEYMYSMAEEGNNDIMLDGDGPHVTKAPSDVGSVKPESSMMI